MIKLFFVLPGAAASHLRGGFILPSSQITFMAAINEGLNFNRKYYNIALNYNVFIIPYQECKVVKSKGSETTSVNYLCNNPSQRVMLRLWLEVAFAVA